MHTLQNFILCKSILKSSSYFFSQNWVLRSSIFMQLKPLSLLKGPGSFEDNESILKLHYYNGCITVYIY